MTERNDQSPERELAFKNLFEDLAAVTLHLNRVVTNLKGLYELNGKPSDALSESKVFELEEPRT